MSEYLHASDVAVLLGVGTPTVNEYLKRTRRHIADGGAQGPLHLPLPDRYFGRTPVWERTTIVTWVASRPGSGAHNTRRNPDGEVPA